MLSLVCMVVNDGSFVVANMDETKTVDELKQTITRMKKFNFSADQLTLLLAKTENDQWLHLSVDELGKLQNGETIDAVESVLTKGKPIDTNTLLNSPAFGFSPAGADETEAVHVLVVVHADRWEELRPAKKAKTSYVYDPSIRFQLFTLDPASVLDPTTVADGTLQCTQTLSNAFHDFGGFPAKLLVRKEMQMVWTILHDNYVGANPPNEHCGLLGSFGVGKSALLHLFCCYLAVKHKFNILLVRDVSRVCNGTNAVLWFRGSHVTGYPSCDRKDLRRLKKEFESEHKGTKNLIVCVGYYQSELDKYLEFFSSCDLLATSAQYTLKSSDDRKLLLLPAWRQNHLRELAKAFSICDFDEWYAYSGGSVRNFSRKMENLKERRMYALYLFRSGPEIGLQQPYGAPSNSDLEWIQLIFTSNVEEREGYSRAFKWKRIVDSSVTLMALASKWRLATIGTTLAFAQSLKEEALYRQVFEVLVHKLAHDRSLELDVRDSTGDLSSSSCVAVTRNVSVKVDCGDDGYISPTNDQKWALCLAFLTNKATDNMYWYPGCLRYPGVDSVIIVDGVVHYVHVTVAPSIAINWDEVRLIHQAVVANKAIQPKAFKYVVVTPRTTPWGTFEGMMSDIPGLAMCHAHATHDLAT